ncbi:subunit of tubulin prefoldin [Xanthoria parietina]
MTSKDAPTQPQSQPINLSTLPIPQLTAIKNQLTQELQHLTTSFTQLRTAQAKFRDCIKSVRDGIEKKGANKAQEGGASSSKPILVPLTPSLYVPGTLASTETVLVDIGTGFYVEKTPPAARQFYTAKVEELGKNLKDLETIVQGKQGNLTVVEDGTLWTCTLPEKG